MREMTCAECLEALGWTAGDLARRLNIGDRPATRWLSGKNPTPPNILAWLRLLALHQVEHSLPEGWEWENKRYEAANGG
jgi:hypothetical protein